TLAAGGRMTQRYLWVGLAAAIACSGTDDESQTVTAEETTGAETAAVQPIPEGFRSVTPHLVVTDIPAAIAWYAQALGAEQTLLINGPGGTPIHGEMRIGDSVIMVGAEEPQQGARAPSSVGGTCGGLMVYVEDVDAAVARATEAGATVGMPVTDMFWGDRYGQIVDPQGHHWSLATHKFEAPMEEMGARAEAFGRAMASGEAPPTYDDPPATSWRPENMPVVTPSLVVASAADLDLYVAAFGATEVSRTLGPGGSLMHGELRVGDTIVMFTQADPEHAPTMKTPSELGGVPMNLMLYVEDVDAAHAQAVSAGATNLAPVQDMFWGDRWGAVSDGAGHMWGIATHVADLTPEEIQQRMIEQFGGGGG
ncbi:MAG: VOC family protein, partial [Myxococcota bacterium]